MMLVSCGHEHADKHAEEDGGHEADMRADKAESADQDAAE